MLVKICGVTNKRDFELTAEAKADIVGFIFIPGTPRAVNVEEVSKILSGEERQIEKAGLFMDRDISEVADIASRCDLDYVQLQGDETPGYIKKLKEVLPDSRRVIKAFKVGKEVRAILSRYPEEYGISDFFVFDTFHPIMAGGTGKTYDHCVIKHISSSFHRPFFVAGGLNPDNVAQVVKKLRPYGVDVSSGVESFPRKKNAQKLKEFVSNAKKTST